MSDVEIGKLAPPDADRDAVHVACVPLIATTEMEPGTHAGIIEAGHAGLTSTDRCIGIVDPFLRENVKPGQRFWLFLYPRTVTGLRHHYAHPALDGDTPATSRDWIERFCAANAIHYGELMDHAMDWVGTHDGKYSGEYWCDGGRFEGMRVPDEFWDHYDRVRGVVTPDVKRGNFFTFAC